MSLSHRSQFNHLISDVSELLTQAEHQLLNSTNPSEDRWIKQNIQETKDQLEQFRAKINLVKKSDTDDGQQQADESILINQTLSRAYLIRGNALACLKNYHRSIEDLNQAIELNPSNEVAYRNRGGVYTCLEEYQPAINDLNQAIALNPSDGIAYYSRGNVKFHLGQYQEAIKDFEQAIELKPQDIRFYRGLALTYKVLEDNQQAIINYDRAIELDPEDALTYHNRGAVYAWLNDYNQALEDFTRAIELNPNYATAYQSRATAYFLLKDYRRAIENYDKLIELEPNNSVAYNARGAAYAWLNENEKAVEDYNQAIKLDSKFVKAYTNRGVSFKKLYKYEQALSDFEQANHLDSKNATKIVIYFHDTHQVKWWVIIAVVLAYYLFTLFNNFVPYKVSTINFIAPLASSLQSTTLLELFVAIGEAGVILSAFLIALGLICWVGRLKLHDIGLNRVYLWPAIIITFIVWVISQLLMLLYELSQNKNISVDSHWIRSTPISLITYLVNTVFLVITLEEIVFRGFLLPQLSAKLHGPWRLITAFLISQILSAVTILPVSLAMGRTLSDLLADFGWVVLNSLVLAYLYAETNNLFLCIGFHALLSNSLTLFNSSLSQPFLVFLFLYLYLNYWPIGKKPASQVYLPDTRDFTPSPGLSWFERTLNLLFSGFWIIITLIMVLIAGVLFYTVGVTPLTILLAGLIGIIFITRVQSYIRRRI